MCRTYPALSHSWRGRRSLSPQALLPGCACGKKPLKPGWGLGASSRVLPFCPNLRVNTNPLLPLSTSLFWSSPHLLRRRPRHQISHNVGCCCTTSNHTRRYRVGFPLLPSARPGTDTPSLRAIFTDQAGAAQRFPVPVLQCLQIKPLPANPAGGGPERYRVVLSDIRNYVQCMLATQANHVIHDNQLQRGCIVRVKSYQPNSVKGKK